MKLVKLGSRKVKLYPVIPIGARITTEDIVLDGYHIPKGTCLMINNYAMSRDERNFPNANEFIPERWFRSDTRKFHPFAVIPFGHGSRSCIGRRIAELELYLAITHLCQNFRLKVEDGFEVEPFLRTVLTVGKNFPIQFIERLLSISVYQIHSQGTTQWELNPEPCGWEAFFLPHSHACTYIYYRLKNLLNQSTKC
ncbi:cytochrome P450 27C1-like [Octopus vulgaris]|uniref:Cholesterol side-chain cleavage enzyme, mitochondrial n=1 Tax=Octopus vulgaris TaxID=6645 RepID=A0AA36ANL9_OCTVU|nr:cytochrome P450 27C1-like [Octopus vulgaris]